MAEESHEAVIDVIELQIDNSVHKTSGTSIQRQQQRSIKTSTCNTTNNSTLEPLNPSTNTIDTAADNVANIVNVSHATSQMHDETAIKKLEGPTNKQQLLLQDLNVTPLNADISAGTPYKPLAIQSVAGKSCRFPKLEECAHFHYERVQLGALSVCLVNERVEQQSVNGGDSSVAPTSLQLLSLNNIWFLIRVSTQQTESFLIKRSFDNMRLLDEMLHRCVYDRKISGLRHLKDFIEISNEQETEYLVGNYLERFSKIASDSITCGTILTWLQLDNKGRRLPLADDDTMRSINTPAVGAAYGVRRYQAQAQDEISIELGDMISVIDMPTPAESVWWRGKKSNWQKSHYEVGFFPQSCVATIGDKVPRYFPLPAPLVAQVDISPTKPVLRKHGKLIAFFRSFILSRPSRRRLKQSGIYRERVFSCDLSEHLLNSAQDIPLVLKYCAEFIEAHGIVDGIYRLSGITSTIQRLRQAFDEERIPDLGNPEMRQDIHAVSSLLKMYFRELPNPLCTYQLYDNFVAAVEVKSDDKERLRLMKETVIKLPPPHYRTLRYLARHLHRISQYAERTGMTDKNLAIVWAPNLLRSPALEAGGVAALRGVGVQAVVTEFLIRNSLQIFNDIDTPQLQITPILEKDLHMPNSLRGTEIRLDSLTDCESLLVKQRELDQNVIVQERPKSINVCGAKLISLEEAQERQSQKEGNDNIRITTNPINLPNNMGSYIEVGGGPASLPDKYHTILSVPRSWQKRKTHSWKSIFTRNQRVVSQNLPQKTVEHVDQHSAHKLLAQQANKPEIKIVEGKLMKEHKTKSVEFNKMIIETGNVGFGKGSDSYLRSNSIDSLRTAGHSRSVSHDSYFDLLQSPLHQLNNTSPSRELTELGLNFDREEPEMRIFSESESLVSSPRVGKENLPPNYVCFNARRVIRARPEEFFGSQTNSINPSPKKQPRLNLLLSPKNITSVGGDKKLMEQQAVEISVQNNEHFSKRYKYEDEFPDIQFIDCSTPEHTMNNNSSSASTSTANYGPHKMPRVNSKNYLHNNETHDLLAVPNTHKQQPTATSTNKHNNYSRYSYPSLQLGVKHQDNELFKERLSYPITIEKTHLRNNKKTEKPKILAIENSLNVTGSSRSVQRNSYCGNNDDPKSIMFRRSNSTDCATKPFKETDIIEATSKISMTPSSTAHSPHYTLLGGDTSSENSSIVNTPQYEVVDGLASIPILHNNNTVKTENLNESEDSLEYEEIAVKSQLTHLLAKKALRNELSLNLIPFIPKSKETINTTIDYTINSEDEPRKQIHGQRQTQQQQIPQLLLSPNSSIMTDNTSASVTPSEFGYQSLQRQSSTNSLLDMDDEATVAILNRDSPLSANNLMSPIQKSTISITYNLRSEKKANDENVLTMDRKFDESNVYEQLKIFRNSVSELNEIFQDKEQLLQTTKKKENNEKAQKCKINKGDTSEQQKNKSKKNIELQSNITENNTSINTDYKTYDNSVNDNEGLLNKKTVNDNKGQPIKKTSSLNKLLYENVQLRKPNNMYANVLVTTPTATTKTPETENRTESETKSEIVKLPRIKSYHKNNNNNNDNNIAHSNNINNIKNNNQNKTNKQMNFSVKELANKFENTSSEQQQSILRASKKSLVEETALSTGAGSGATIKLQQKLHNAKQITRSLDEEAFQREFNNVRQRDELTGGSVMQLPDELADLVSQRRKSFDFTRPKTLNPPKRLPGMSSKTIPILEQAQESDVGRPAYEFQEETQHQQHLAEVLVTPTTETAALDFSNPHLLSGVKLDRERIDRIKEERRQQLTKKYGLKSRSKTELNTDMNFNKEIIRTRSKSRGDVSEMELDRDDHYLNSSDMNILQCKGVDIESNRFTQNRKPISLCQKQTTGINPVECTIVLDNNEIGNKNVTKEREKVNKENTTQRNLLLIKTDDNIKCKNNLTDSTTGARKTTKSRTHGSSSSINNDINIHLTTKTNATREQISPQFSIRDVTAMFESRSQSQQ